MIKKLEKILKDVSRTIIMNPHFESVTTYKDKDVVTVKDLEAERAIIRAIKEIRPNDVFISEEENQTTLTDENTWIIDPIDGTLNFTRNIPQFGIQVAYYENKEPQLSMMYFPLEDTVLYAEKGQGCYVNHVKLPLREPYTIDQSIVTFGDFSRSQPESRPIQLDMMTNVINHVMKTRIYGASSTDFAYVIMNRTQAHVIFTKRIWELASGLFMAEEAGLDVTEIHVGTVSGVIIGHTKLTAELMVLCNLKDNL